MSRLGDWISEHRKARPGLTLEKLALIVWCSASYLGKLERGYQHHPGLRTIIRLADALSYDEDDRISFLQMSNCGCYSYAAPIPSILEYMQQFPLLAQ